MEETKAPAYSEGWKLINRHLIDLTTDRPWQLVDRANWRQLVDWQLIDRLGDNSLTPLPQFCRCVGDEESVKTSAPTSDRLGQFVERPAAVVRLSADDDNAVVHFDHRRVLMAVGHGRTPRPALWLPDFVSILGQCYKTFFVRNLPIFVIS